MPKHPIQPIEKDVNGYPRFKKNKIVEYLLDNGGVDLNMIAALSHTEGFSQNDHEQFAQLIGYSLSGFSELSYVSDETYEAAEKMYKKGLDERDAKIEYYVETIEKVRQGLKIAVPAVCRIHPDDLEEESS